MSPCTTKKDGGACVMRLQSSTLHLPSFVFPHPKKKRKKETEPEAGTITQSQLREFAGKKHLHRPAAIFFVQKESKKDNSNK